MEKITIIEDGKPVEYDVIMDFTSKKYQKNYLFYVKSDRKLDKTLEILVSNYRIVDNNIYTYPIENKEEMDMCNDILNDIKKELNFDK